jgi:hypothetical protein
MKQTGRWSSTTFKIVQPHRQGRRPIRLKGAHKNCKVESRFLQIMSDWRCCFQTVDQYTAHLLMMFEEIVLLSFEQPAGHHMLEGAQNEMAQEINAHIRSDDTLLLPLCDNIQYRTYRLLQEVVCSRLDETLAHPHLEHQDSSIVGVRLEKIEKVPYEFPEFVESARNPLEMKFELTTKFVRFFYGDGEKQVFLVLEILIDRAVGDTGLLSYFGNTCRLEVLLAEDLNRRLDDGFSPDDLLGHVYASGCRRL